MPGGVTSASCTVSKMTSITPSPHDGTITYENGGWWRRRQPLVELLGPPVAAPARYFLAVAPGAGEKPEARAFLDWLRAETGKSDADGKAAVETAARGEG